VNSQASNKAKVYKQD